jgi:hypothetical protein
MCVLGADVKTYIVAIMAVVLFAGLVTSQIQQSYSSSGMFKVTVNGMSSNLFARGNVIMVLGNISDSDNDSLVDIPTEMLALQLVGSGPLGNVTVNLSTTDQSKGIVEAKKNKTSSVNLNKTSQTYPARSFFDVFVEIDMPARNVTKIKTITVPGHGRGRSNQTHSRLNMTVEEIPAMTLFNKEPIKIRANAVIKGGKTSVHGLYRSLTGEVDLFDRSNPDGPPVGKLKLHFLQLRKPFR